jgi:hypothetical protein
MIINSTASAQCLLGAMRALTLLVSRVRFATTMKSTHPPQALIEYIYCRAARALSHLHFPRTRIHRFFPAPLRRTPYHHVYLKFVFGTSVAQQTLGGAYFTKTSNDK